MPSAANDINNKKRNHHVKQLLTSGWNVLQDVHDAGEALRLFENDLDHTAVGHQISEWEPIERLQHLQVLFAAEPYWGRALRYFNQAPWWYSNEFELSDSQGRAEVRFTNVDYFCKVWLNGTYLGEHEGYSTPFAFDVTEIVRPGETNRLVVKVWSPWDDDIHEDAHEHRTFRVIRDLVKGTYEHDDTLIARDVNPVGIYGSVEIEVTNGVRIARAPVIAYTLSEDRNRAEVSVQADIAGSGPTDITVRITDAASGFVVAESKTVAKLTGDNATAVRLELSVDDIVLWSTWDFADPQLYEVEVIAGDAVSSTRIGFRTVEMIRTAEQTTLVLNGAPFYIRGTSYFPDVYLSTMTRERYVRDLHAIRAAGFNLIRVHVHVELDAFYELCDELGLAVMQDSEYNWTHPVEPEWADRLIRIYLQTMKALDHHPSIVTWICLNEPGVLDGTNLTGGYAMSVSPGPRMYDAVVEADSTRPVIKGSFCNEDPLSGDSHNYRGSLEGPEHYTTIDHTTEKLNTEFGFDAPGSEANLRLVPRLVERLRPVLTDLAEIQEYQYRLVKYYIEHYRAQKGSPNSGYIQFMFIDLSPQSFYGVYDWWGVPKRALDALQESNQPVIVLIEQTAQRASALWVINDSMQDFGTVTVTLKITDGDMTLLQQTSDVSVGADAKVRVLDLDVTSESTTNVNAVLTVRASDGKLITRNRYDNMFTHPVHVKGHPSRMSHELGMRLYSA